MSYSMNFVKNHTIRFSISFGRTQDSEKDRAKGPNPNLLHTVQISNAGPQRRPLPAEQSGIP